MAIKDKYFHKVEFEYGINEVISSSNSSLSKITLSLLKLNKGEIKNIATGADEKAAILLSGSFSVKFHDSQKKMKCSRSSVFSDLATALYLPPRQELTINVIEDIEMIIVSSLSDRLDYKPRIILPSEVTCKTVGQSNWERKVFDIIGKDFPADKLIIGETYNLPGNWSSSPPHKHDYHNPPQESLHEEIYFYKIEPSQGFGLQRLYSADGSIDEAYVIKNNSILEIPKGYHPVVAAPGYQLYYFWVLVGENREPIWSEDPDHKWVHKES